GGGDRIKGYRAPDYLLTGMLGYGVAATAFSGLAIVLVIRRETGVLKRLRATPLPAHVYITAVLLTSLIAFAIEAVFLIALGMLMFDAVFPKSVASVVVALLLGGATFAVLGIGVSGLVRRAEGASAVITALYLPLSFISGAFFSQQHFPIWLKKIADVLPLTYFIDLMGAVMLRGVQLWDRPEDVAVIAAWGLVGAVLARRFFRWVPYEG
ncbi:MAG: ABC transporter permease, partial [Actinobacteria bacterium]